MNKSKGDCSMKLYYAPSKPYCWVKDSTGRWWFPGDVDKDSMFWYCEKVEAVTPVVPERGEPLWEIIQGKNWDQLKGHMGMFTDPKVQKELKSEHYYALVINMSIKWDYDEVEREIKRHKERSQAV